MSKANLYKAAKEEGLKVSRKKIDAWFDAQRTYTRFRPSKKSFERRQTCVSCLGKQLLADLVDLVDVFSRYAFCRPIRQKHKEFMVPAMTRILEEHMKRFGKYLETMQFDEGKEFYNVGVLSLLKDKEITWFSTRITSKQAMLVERFNKSLKEVMWKHFDHEGDKRWVDVLSLLVDNVNHKKNSSIGMPPIK